MYFLLLTWEAEHDRYDDWRPYDTLEAAEAAYAEALLDPTLYIATITSGVIRSTDYDEDDNG